MIILLLVQYLLGHTFKLSHIHPVHSDFFPQFYTQLYSHPKKTLSDFANISMSSVTSFYSFLYPPTYRISLLAVEKK